MSAWLNAIFQKENPPLENWLSGEYPIYIYGAGTFARDAYRALIQKGAHVSAFLDHRQEAQKQVDGLPVLSPQSAKDAVVVIGIHNRDADVLDIVRNLKAIGAKKIISAVEIYQQIGNLLGERYWLAKQSFYKPCQKFIENAYALLKDDESRQLYRAILEFRWTGDCAILPEPDFENQYASPSVPAWHSPLRLVDCGAYEGDTLAFFLSAGMQIEALVALEPDSQNFAKLSQFVASRRSQISEATLFPCGAFHSTTTLSFKTGFGEASALSEAGGQTIQCVALDEVIPNFAPNLIKMDVEGSECDALFGARKIINQHLPNLALAVYHRPDHLWRIPLIVEEIAPQKYDFYLRSHARSSFETALYGIRKSE
ncbi:MAG: FkbM family methyltransferase [Anaerolineales bacterium]|nr:FkbM family methyltransferase [Anaerolineales bacterium]